jgi:hypothetical protein
MHENNAQMNPPSFPKAQIVTRMKEMLNRSRKAQSVTGICELSHLGVL